MGDLPCCNWSGQSGRSRQLRGRRRRPSVASGPGSLRQCPAYVCMCQLGCGPIAEFLTSPDPPSPWPDREVTENGVPVQNRGVLPPDCACLAGAAGAEKWGNELKSGRTPFPNVSPHAVPLPGGEEAEGEGVSQTNADNDSWTFAIAPSYPLPTGPVLSQHVCHHCVQPGVLVSHYSDFRRRSRLCKRLRRGPRLGRVGRGSLQQGGLVLGMRRR
jgi:hypothetical protein